MEKEAFEAYKKREQALIEEIKIMYHKRFEQMAFI
jgi:hypothetical protein